MSRSMLAALTLLAVAACGRGDKREVASADSLSRDLQLAPVDTSATLNDRPSADTAVASAPAPEPAPRRPQPAPKPTPKPAAPKPKPAAPKPAPKPAEPAPAPAPTPAAAPAGCRRARRSRRPPTPRFARTRTRWATRSQATVGSDVKDASGRVVIPAGSKVTLQVTAIKESENKGDTTGTLTLKPTGDLDQRAVAAAPRLDLGREADARRAAAPTPATSPRWVPAPAAGADRRPGHRRQHEGRDHRRHHRWRGRHAAGGRDQGPRCRGAGRHHRDAHAERQAGGRQLDAADGSRRAKDGATQVAPSFRHIAFTLRDQLTGPAA